jgi:Lanthionine synthetase C-like protein
MLFSPDAHEPLINDAWRVEGVRSAIATIVADAEGSFEDGWPTHPQDHVEGEHRSSGFRSVYLGGAGVVAALHRLSQRGLVELRRSYVSYLENALNAEQDFPDEDGQRSLWMGEVGIRLVLQRVAPSAPNLDHLARLIAANERDERRELMWGSPGTILAGRELRLDVSASVEWLRGQRDEDGLWTQNLYGEKRRFLGPAHGFAGCALALGDLPDVTETLRRHAVVEDGLANWPALAGRSLDAAPDRHIRVQWCHGAPGIVATLGQLLDKGLALAGGELTWRAGPLRKGANLCHGTAGNGYAFLALHRRTGDELWLERARRFAMHAVAQVEEARTEHGQGRYSLWTGDIGTALYLADCIDGGGDLPLP